MIIAILAILKSGAAYLPIDPDSPDERINSMLEQSQALVFLTLSDHQQRFSQLHSNVVVLDELKQRLKKYSIKPTGVVSDNNDLAYVIFTSGSSGKPKGVLLEHGALARRLAGLISLFSIKEGYRIGQAVQFNFDPSLIEIFLPLIQGGCLVLAPERHQTSDEMAQFVVEKKINMLALVPSGLRALLDGLSDYSKSELRVVCCGGEVLSAGLAQQFIRQTNAKLFNVYGPTEAVILATAWDCSNTIDGELPLGRPVNDTQIYVVDTQNKLLPLGVNGEIIVGVNVARGYLHAEEMTRNAFFTANYVKDESRFYKTGDLGYIGLDGQLYFAGRIDRQIKISGYRIEPGEIEMIIESHLKVRLAAVASFNDQKNKVLYAFVEFEREALNVDVEADYLSELSALLRSSLPDYMQPRAIIPMVKIPQSSSGKINYSALLHPGIKHVEHKHRLPESQLEAHLMQYWEEVLDTHELGISDNFFDLGGDSLSAVKLIKKIEAIAGHHCPLSFLLEYPTIEQQAEVLAGDLPSIAAPLLTTLSKYEKTPQFYLAASGHGDVIRFSNLAAELGNVCSLHMLQPSGLIGSVEHKSIEGLARSYAELILIREEEPGYIGGFSIGGITALETARILTEQGKPPLGVLLLDTVYPHRLLKSSVLYSLLRFISKQPLLNKVPVNGRRMETMLADPGIRTQLIALRKYKMSTYTGDVALLISSGLWWKRWFFSKWNVIFTSGFHYYSITGIHGGIFQVPHLKGLSQAILKYIKGQK